MYCCLTSAPHRITFAGGGSDFPNYFLRYDGKVITSTIDYRVWVLIQSHSTAFSEKFRIHYSKIEKTNSLNKIENDIIRITLKYFEKRYGPTGPLTITTAADIPSSSGLGSSSAFTVALIQNLSNFYGLKLKKSEIASLACKIEITYMKKPIGMQDQYATTFGGFNIIEFKSTGKVLIKPFKLELNSKILLQNSLILISSNYFRKAEEILKYQHKPNKSQVNIIHQMKFGLNNFLTRNKSLNKFNVIENFGELIANQVKLKNSLNKYSNSKEISKLYFTLEKFGVYSYKVNGAGGGGFVTALVEPSKLHKLKKELKIRNYSTSTVIFTSKGVRTDFIQKSGP